MAKTRTTFVTSIDLGPDARNTVIALCNQQLADTFDLYSQVKQAHWNIKGAQFIALHKLYDDLAEELLEYADAIAERATALGGLATGTVRMTADATRLPEFGLEIFGSLETVRALVERYAHYAKTTRAAIDKAEAAGDMGSADLFTEISLGTDKALWFLEAHLQD